MLARLLASSRLLDMAIANQQDVERLTEAFLSKNIIFLKKDRRENLKNSTSEPAIFAELRKIAIFIVSKTVPNGGIF